MGFFKVQRKGSLSKVAEIATGIYYRLLLVVAEVYFEEVLLA